MPYCKIMLCTDGSDFAVGAERVALVLAKKCQAELIWYSVVEWHGNVFLRPFTVSNQEHQLHYIESRMSALKGYHEELKKKFVAHEIAYLLKKLKKRKFLAKKWYSLEFPMK